jgi:hypothetical protein
MVEDRRSVSLRFLVVMLMLIRPSSAGLGQYRQRERLGVIGTCDLSAGFDAGLGKAHLVMVLAVCWWGIVWRGNVWELEAVHDRSSGRVVTVSRRSRVLIAGLPGGGLPLFSQECHIA